MDNEKLTKEIRNRIDQAKKEEITNIKNMNLITNKMLIKTYI